jgi:hypothetical protein
MDYGFCPAWNAVTHMFVFTVDIYKDIKIIMIVNFLWYFTIYGNSISANIQYYLTVYTDDDCIWKS